MGTINLTLDDEAEESLQRLRDLTGSSISDLLKLGLLAYEAQIEKAARHKPFDIYRVLDLGPGGYASISAREAKSEIVGVIGRRQKR